MNTYALVDADNYATIDRNAMIEVRTVKGDVVEGSFVSVNTKGINVKLNTGRVVSRSLATVAQVALIILTPDTPMDLFSDDATYTTADLAAALTISAYDLRVQLRDRGLGVGKGNKYGFDADEARKLYTALSTTTA
jgi:hypothetical protein